MNKNLLLIIILTFYLFKGYGQNCDSIYYLYDSLDDNNIINDVQRKIKLDYSLKVCPDYEIGYWQRLGLVYEKHHTNDSALYCFNKALKLIDISKQFGYLNSVLINIGNVYMRLNLLNKALEYYNMDTLKRISNINTYYTYVYYFNKADLFSKLKKFNLAFHYYYKAQQLVDTSKNINEKVSLALLKCSILVEQNLIKVALLRVKDVFELRFHEIDELCRQSLYSTYAYTQDQYVNKKLVSLFADTAIFLARLLNNESILNKTLSDMGSVYFRLGDSTKAYKALLEWKDLNDTLQKRNLLEAIKIAEFEIQQELVTRELKIQKTQVKLQSIKLYISIFSIILLSVTSIVGIFYYRQRQRLNKQNLLIKDNEIKQLLNEQDLQFLNAKLTGQIGERKRIATELHNSLGNMLAFIKLGFENLVIKNRDQISKIEKIDVLNEQIDDACSKLRLISHTQYDQSWLYELKSRLNNLSTIHGFKTLLLDNGVKLSENLQLELDIFTISEGLLSNTIKYSQASEIIIQLTQFDNTIAYSYEDNGVGFDPQLIFSSDGLGYRILKERVEFHHGTWYLDTSIGKGMIIFIEFPIR